MVTDKAAEPMVVVRGVVVLKEWMRWLNDRTYMGFYGNIQVVENKSALGFSMHGQDSGFSVIVAGSKAHIDIFGCQVRAIIESKELKPINNGAYLIVP